MPAFLKISFVGAQDHPYYARNLFLLKNFGWYYGFEVTDESGYPKLVWNKKPESYTQSCLTKIQYLPIEYRKDIKIKISPKNLVLPTHPFHGENQEALPDKTSSTPVLNLDILSFCSDILWKKADTKPENLTHSRNAHCHPEDRALKLHQHPLVDYWMDWLFNTLRWRYPDIAPKSPRPASIWLTHDVDIVSKWTGRFLVKRLLSLPKTLISNPQKLKIDLSEIWQAIQGEDVYNQLKTIRQIEGKAKSTFFFLGKSKDHLSKRYRVNSRGIKKNIQDLNSNGFDIGLHGVEGAVTHTDNFAMEKKRVSQALQKETKIHRSHFLKWEPQKSFNVLAENGIQIDSTMGYNNTPGFRCGTSRPFFWWDLEKDKASTLLEIPLITAEFQFADADNFNPELCWDQWLKYYEKCRFPGSVCCHLHHNLYFYENDFPGHKQWYLNLLNFISAENIEIFSPLPFYQNIKKSILP